jgi:hypothetical protein
MTISRDPIDINDDPVPLITRDGINGDEPLDDLTEERMDRVFPGFKPVKLIRGYPVDEFYQT